MPKLTAKITHDLGQITAIQRMKDSCEWAHSISDLHETWNVNVVTFRVSIQGIKISGTIEVTDDAVMFVGQVPLIALPFKSWTYNILQNSLKPRNLVDHTKAALSEQPLLFYLHIPKAGGTTLGEFIYNQCRDVDGSDEGLIKHGVFFTPDGFFRDTTENSNTQFQPLLRRNDLRAVMGHFAYGLHDLIERPFQYITILREPVSRVVSLYYYLKLEDKLSLDAFANDCPYREIDNDQTRRIAGVNPEIGQCTGLHLALAKENLRKDFAVVGTTERFDETLVLLKQRFAWTREMPAYPRNVNKERKELASLSETTIKAIQNRNVFDIALHQYANQLMDESIAAHGTQFPELLNQQRAVNTYQP